MKQAFLALLVLLCACSTDTGLTTLAVEDAANETTITIDGGNDQLVNWVDFTFQGVRTRDNDAPFNYTVDETKLKTGTYTVDVRVSIQLLGRASINRRTASFTVASAPAPVPADVLWSADHETGSMSEWYQGSGGGEFNSGGGTSGVSTVQARSGNYSAALRIQNVNGDQGVRLFRWAEPQRNGELYYSVWYYFPERYVAPNWWNVFQFKSKTSSKNDPFYILNVGNRSDGQMHFYMYDWQRRRSYPQSSVNIPVGRWFQVEAYYKSRGDNTGAITVWQDGVQLFKVSGVSTRYPDGDTQFAINSYTDRISPDPATIFVDDASISLNR